MMKTGAMVIVSAALLAGCSTFTDDTMIFAAAETETTEREFNGSYDPDEVVCRRVKVTATHFPRRVCHTRRQLQVMRDEARTTFQNIDRGQRSSDPR